MAKRTTRVLIVESSVMTRNFLLRVFKNETGLDVAGVTSMGKEVLPMILKCSPDVVTLSASLPDPGCIEIVKSVRRDHPHLPIILFCDLTRRSAAITFSALELGAADYVTRWPVENDVGQGLDLIRREMVPKILALGRRGVPAPLEKAKGRNVLADFGAKTSARAQIVVIGTSAGGPAALKEILTRLPAGFPVPILVVQHMMKSLAEQAIASLGESLQLRVLEGADGVPLRPGEVHISPIGRHMVVKCLGARRHIGINDEPPRHYCRPSVDVLFGSAAEVYGRGVLAVVLTGMGKDGLEGCERVRKAGGQVLVQDRETSVVWEMPGEVFRAGLAQGVFAIGDIAREIILRTTADAKNAPHCKNLGAKLKRGPS